MGRLRVKSTLYHQYQLSVMVISRVGKARSLIQVLTMKMARGSVRIATKLDLTPTKLVSREYLLFDVFSIFRLFVTFRRQ